jgi:hypothetical protein
MQTPMETKTAASARSSFLRRGKDGGPSVSGFGLALVDSGALSAATSGSSFSLMILYADGAADLDGM